MVTKLIGRTGTMSGCDFVIPEDCSMMRIGAGAANEIRIKGEGVSREHARILRRPDGCWVEDAGSRNGTFINGLQLKMEKLRHLDVVTFARRVDLIFIQTALEVPPPESKASSAALEALNGPSAGTTVDIPLGELTIGRVPSCNLTFDHPAIGKRHARIVRTDSQVTIEDLQSTNGTFVNDRRITLDVLHDGDRIALAGVAQFRMILRGAPGADVPLEDDDNNEIEPVYNTQWKTRYVWSPSELNAIASHDPKVLEFMEWTMPPGGSRPPPIPRPEPPALDETVSTASVPTVLAAKPMMPAIRAVELTGQTGGPVVLRQGSHTIGREADVILPKGDRQASRIHSVLTVQADSVTVEDRSVNGTFVNGDRAAGPCSLLDGDTLQCGGTTFTVRLVRGHGGRDR